VQAGGVIVADRPAYGYRYVAGDRTGTLEPDAAEAPVVRQMYAWCADEGLTTYAIAQRLYDAGVPTRADTNGVVAKKGERHFWNPHTVARILRSETYRGAWAWNKTRRVKRGERTVQEARPRDEWITVNVPAIIDDATWSRAQDQLDRNRANARRNARRQYLLSGRLFCTCGRRFTASYKRRIDRAYYRCSTSKTEPWRAACTSRFGYEQNKLEAGVLDAIKAFLLDPDVRAAGVGAERERLDRDRKRATDQLRAVERHLSDVDRRLASLLDDALTAGFPVELVDRRKRDLLAERERRLSEREQALSRLADADVPDLEAAITALAPVVERAFAVAAPAELRHLLDVLRVEVHVVDRETVRLTGVVGGSDGSIVTLSSGGWRSGSTGPRRRAASGATASSRCPAGRAR
ncbi:MAG: recombinase family protein, partial [Thermomicrobiales bacterium]|nr:recombinase family protein [Thermomicrobiales bacterium]